MPIAVSFSFISADSRALMVSRLSREMISGGVRAGANSPYHTVTTRLSTPASFAVGTSGSDGRRLSESTASGRTLPARICGIADATGRITSSTSPEISAIMPTVAPLYGTCTMSIFSLYLSSSLAR
jgi:hypothetical protein